MEAGTTTIQITMPEMGESVTEGTILEWLKQVGDDVELDEGLVEVSTDKVDTEVPSRAGRTVAMQPVLTRVGKPRWKPVQGRFRSPCPRWASR